MKLDINILIRKIIIAFLLFMNIICLFSSQYLIAYTEENGDCKVNYRNNISS